jgi:hypothetical protein
LKVIRRDICRSVIWLHCVVGTPSLRAVDDAA